jgi:hypothetical protein
MLSLFDVFITLFKFKHMTIPTTYKMVRNYIMIKELKEGEQYKVTRLPSGVRCPLVLEKALIPFVRCHLSIRAISHRVDYRQKSRLTVPKIYI